MTVSRHFSSSYAAAREKFLAAAASAGARVESFRHPLRGPAGEMLFTDVARLGPDDASRVLLTISATHGVEGHCGSGAQVAAFAEGALADLGRDTASVAVHAINPHGFAWSRRVTEDNVDLNRNFVDHARPYPVNPGYIELRESICPSVWTEATRRAAERAFAAYRDRHGPMAFQQAVSGGQYGDPEGIFFGGNAPTWSNRMLRRIFARLAERARHIAVVDYHTGLGPWGRGELINPGAPDDPAFHRLVEWLGRDDVTSPALGNSSSAPLVGTNNFGMAEAAAGAAVTMVAVEYGVKPLTDTFDALRADNWLHVHGDFAAPEAGEIKRQMRAAFYGDADDWKRMIVERAFDVLKRMRAGLARA